MEDTINLGEYLLDTVEIPVEKRENDYNKGEELIRKPQYRASELLARGLTKIPCLLDPIFPKVGLGALAGSSDTGKSCLLRQFAIAVAHDDTDFLGWKLHLDKKRAVYVSTEDDDYATSTLLHKANLEKKRPIEEYDTLTFIYETHDLLNQLEEQLTNEPADLVIIDAFSDLYGKSMNDSNQVRTFLNEYSQLAQRHRCLVLFLHHTGKQTDDRPPSKHNLLGSQGFEAKMRIVLELRADISDQCTKHLCVVKGNYLPNEYKTESYVLVFNENLQFEATGNRVLFEDLTKKRVLKHHNIDEIMKLKDEGKSQDQIAAIMKISQPKVSRLIKEHNEREIIHSFSTKVSE